MALSNAQKQARWWARNVLVLTQDADAIASKLIDDVDPAKLRMVVRRLGAHLAESKNSTLMERHNAETMRLSKAAGVISG